MLPIKHWEPFREGVSLRDAMNTLLEESFVRPGMEMFGNAEFLSVPMDVRETPEGFEVQASLPGLKPEEVEISVHGDRLMIRGETKAEEEKKEANWLLRERRHGSFRRMISLTAPVNTDQAVARFEHGVLTLHLPKAEAARPKQIRVESGKEA